MIADMKLQATDFTLWYAGVEEICNDLYGISLSDLVDQDFLSMFEDGYTPKQAMQEIAENEGMECDTVVFGEDDDFDEDLEL
jgi:hypothetical protein